MLRITKADLNTANFYKTDAIEIDEAIEADENLGLVRFHKNVTTNALGTEKQSSLKR